MKLKAKKITSSSLFRKAGYLPKSSKDDYYVWENAEGSLIRIFPNLSFNKLTVDEEATERPLKVYVFGEYCPIYKEGKFTSGELRAITKWFEERGL